MYEWQITYDTCEGHRAFHFLVADDREQARRDAYIWADAQTYYPTILRIERA